MSDDNQNPLEQTNLNDQNPADDLDKGPDELTMLKQRATMMGIRFSNNISLETLKERIAEKMNGGGDSQSAAKPLVDPAEAKSEVNSAAVPTKTKTLRQYCYEKSMKLVRIRIQCLDPKKRDLPGEIVTVANEYIGQVSKYIPFDAEEDGWHVPMCIYKHLKAKKFLNLRSYTDRRNGGNIKVEQGWSPEFAIEILPPLTPDELRKLGTAQAAAANA